MTAATDQRDGEPEFGPEPIARVVLRRYDGTPIWIRYRGWDLRRGTPEHCERPAEELAQGRVWRCPHCWAELRDIEREVALWLAR